MMRNVTFALCCTTVLVGCGNWDAVYRKHDFKSGNSAITDIKSRAIISSVSPPSNGNEAALRVCAEPSPDALTAYAAELAVKQDVAGKTAASLAGGYQGSAAFTGMRTQSIQLLRDQLYRLCEARLNGWIQDDAYKMLLARNQRFTLALMTIENLSQVAQVPTVTLSSKSAATILDEIGLAQQKLTAAKNERSTLEAIPKDKRTAEQESRLAELVELTTLLEQNIRDGKEAVLTGETSANVASRTSSPAAPSSAAIAAISYIAESMTAQGEDGHECIGAIARERVRLATEPKPTTAEQALLSYCATYFQYQQEVRQNAILKLRQARVAQAGDNTSQPPQQSQQQQQPQPQQQPQQQPWTVPGQGLDGILSPAVPTY